MAVFDPDKYVDENEGKDFFAPKGLYELYFSELAVQEKDGKKSFGGKVVFMDGPRAGKYFFHTFWIYNEDKDKRKQALTWMGNFFRSIGVGAVDIDTDTDQLINKVFMGDVDINEYEGKKRNQLLPWGFHKIGGDAPLANKPSTSASNSSAVSSGSSGSSSEAYVDDIPF